jgi:membrane protease YdiL (CAAX protease family)
MGLATLLAFPLLAWPILYFTNRHFGDLFVLPFHTLFEIPLFLSAGILFGLFIIWLSELPFFETAFKDYKNLLVGFKITRWRAVYLSVCAGVGEEIFFRGAIQPVVGIWITAIFFVAIHGYYSIKNWKKCFLGIMLTLFIGLLGWGARDFSLWHAIAGHFSYDLVLLLYLKRGNGQ